MIVKKNRANARFFDCVKYLDFDIIIYVNGVPLMGCNDPFNCVHSVYG